MQMENVTKVKTVNAISNFYLDFYELVVYDNSFMVQYGDKPLTSEEEKIDRSRKFKIIDNYLLPNKKGVTSKDLLKTLEKSANRALDTINGYILSNDWQYFVTLTFSPNEVNREDKKSVNYAWQKYRQMLQREFPEIKIILLPELHEKGGIHFHGFFGNVNIDKYLTPAINNKEFVKVNGKCKRNPQYKDFLYSSSGAQIFNLTNFKYGFTTVCKISEDTQKLQVAHYMLKYVTKDTKSGVGYNQKRYYHTNNLDFKQQELLFLDNYDLDYILSKNTNYVLYKEKKGMKVYHFQYRSNNNE